MYKQDTLQFLSQEEGRIRPLCVAGRPVNFTYDYFEKDHLGNIRVVLVTKSDTAVYAATMETAAAAVENALFSNIDNTRAAKPIGYPVDNTTSPNDYVAKLNGVNGQKIGPSLVLRVMAGDSITVVSRALYKNTGASTSGSTSSSMVNAILQAFSGSTVSDGVHGGTGSNSPITFLTTGIYDGLKSKDPDQNITTMPKAYLNFAAFDDQFNLVDENSGVWQVKGTVDSLITLVVGKMAIKKTGFIYIYESNESGQDVYFDNLIVTHNSGPLLEETHYYPFGLTMAGISSNALKGSSYPENRKKYNGIEFDDDLDLDQYEANYRSLDPQIGRWGQIDPKVDDMEAWSPYASNYDNPITYSDLLGDEPNNDPPGGIRGFLISLGGLINGINHSLTFGTYDVPAERFGLTDEDAAQYNLATNVGQFIPFLPNRTGLPAAGDVVPVNINPARAIPIPKVVSPALPIVPPYRNASNQKKGPKDLLQEAQEVQAREAAAKEREAKRKQATKDGKNKTGNSNKRFRGEHDSGSRSKSTENDHQNANARRAREQQAADAQKTKTKKKS